MKIFNVPASEIKRVISDVEDPIESSAILADIFRLNALSMIMEAGSGHIGSSFSCMDIITWLWTQEMNKPNLNELDSDYYFSSKGHDAPGLYSLLIGLGLLDYSLIHKLRRLNGLPGHPDIQTPNILTNTGPLGMGISKARGMVLANRLSGKRGHFYILSGDGELEEGQIWESLQPAANHKFSEITLIVDHNKIQSDTWVEKVSSLGGLEEKFRSFGWEVARCDGHDFAALKKMFSDFRKITDKPQVLIADTIKGKGVALMESIKPELEDQLYKFHSGTPSVEIYKSAINEIISRINKKLRLLGQEELITEVVDLPESRTLSNPQKLVLAYGDELARIGGENQDIVVLDADLMVDCGLLAFRQKFPERFVECGIAEQDMVSVAGGLALAGKLPIVHSFACFLSARPNEQIYNNATEQKKIIYCASLAGLLPAAPGHSHQSVRDISTLGSVPGLIMIEPCNEQETGAALRWAVEKNSESSYLRLVSIPCEIPYTLPANYQLTFGKGVKIFDGNEAAIFAYGPVMLTEAFKAAQKLQAEGIGLALYNLPWLNRIDDEWLSETVASYNLILTLDDHYVALGQGDMIAAALMRIGQGAKKMIQLGLAEIPACGQPQEVLKYHGLDSDSIAEKVKENIK